MIKKRTIYQFSENAFSLFTIKAIDLGLTIGLIPYLILIVGLHNYGIYVFMMSLMLFFVNILSYGFDLVAVREIAVHKNNATKLSQIFSEVISVKIALFLMVFLILLLLMLIIPKFWNYKTLFLFSSLLLVNELFSLRWFFLGIEKTKYSALISLIGAFFYVLLVIFFVKEPSDFILIPLMEAIGMIAVSMTAFIWALKSFQIKFQFIAVKQIIHYLKCNFSSFLNLLLPSTYSITLVFMVGIFGVPLQVGLLQLGVKFSNSFSTINTVLTNIFYPIVNRNKAAIPIARIVLISSGIFLSGMMYLGSDFLITNWVNLSSEIALENTINIVKILSPTPFLMAVISSYGVNGLLINYQDQLYAKIIIFATFTMLIFGSYLIPNYYLYGGAITFLTGKLVHTLLSYYFFKRNGFHIASN